jgi:hypothetical protein
VLAVWCRSISLLPESRVLALQNAKVKSKELAGEIFTSTHEFLYLISVRASQIGRSLFYTMSLLSGEVEGSRREASGCSALLSLMR